MKTLVVMILLGWLQSLALDCVPWGYEYNDLGGDPRKVEVVGGYEDYQTTYDHSTDLPRSEWEVKSVITRRTNGVTTHDTVWEHSQAIVDTVFTPQSRDTITKAELVHHVDSLAGAYNLVFTGKITDVTTLPPQETGGTIHFTYYKLDLEIEQVLRGDLQPGTIQTIGKRDVWDPSFSSIVDQTFLILADDLDSLSSTTVKLSPPCEVGGHIEGVYLGPSGKFTKWHYQQAGFELTKAEVKNIITGTSILVPWRGGNLLRPENQKLFRPSGFDWIRGVVK